MQFVTIPQSTFIIQVSGFARKEPRALSAQRFTIMEVRDFHDWQTKDALDRGSRKNVN